MGTTGGSGGVKNDWGNNTLAAQRDIGRRCRHLNFQGGKERKFMTVGAA